MLYLAVGSFSNRPKLVLEVYIVKGKHYIYIQMSIYFQSKYYRIFLAPLYGGRPDRIGIYTIIYTYIYTSPGLPGIGWA